MHCSCFTGTWSQLLYSVNQLGLVGVPDPKTGPAWVSNEWHFGVRELTAASLTTVKVWKTPASDCAKCLHVEHASRGM